MIDTPRCAIISVAARRMTSGHMAPKEYPTMHPQSTTSPDLIPCACGCGQLRPAYDKWGDPRCFIQGHTWRGKHLPAETRQLISERQRGHKQPSHVTAMVRARYKGKQLSPQHRARIGAGVRCSNHPRFNGGRTIQLGYLLLRVEGHPAATKHGYVRAHRLVVEEALGRYLLPSERVHHIDGDTSNNALDNLMLFKSERDHQLFHNGKQVDGISFNS